MQPWEFLWGNAGRLFFPGFLSMGMEWAGGKTELLNKKLPALFSILAEQKSFLYTTNDM